jgi:hypothetical protein
MKGLEWLNKIIPAKNNLDFTIAWIGESNPKPSLTGATGKGILLVNYPLEGQLPFGNAMPLYVALHEAFHQFASNYPSQPAWVSESLASYYGINALQVALARDPNASALLMRFEGDEKKFPEGLLAINRKVLAGDRSEYIAFYTKGIAFWTSVNQALQSQGDDLDHHLLKVFQTQYDSLGNPINLQKNLNLPDKIWIPIRKRFLDDVSVD